jgi:hypothetical protein
MNAHHLFETQPFRRSPLKDGKERSSLRQREKRPLGEQNRLRLKATKRVRRLPCRSVLPARETNFASSFSLLRIL